MGLIDHNVMPYVHLMRLNKPIGIFLLLWPTLSALWISANGVPDLGVLILFIIGKKDNILPYEDLLSQASLPDNGKYVLLDRVGHMGFYEDKKKCFEVLREFTSH